MLLLAADTSGKHGSIALAECEPGTDCRIIEIVPLAGGTFSAQLVPQVADLLQKHGYTKHDLGGFAAASGPGSFTGLRVGLAAMKALGGVLERPIAAVSILEAIATAVKSAATIAAVMDAGRGEVYVGEYEVADTLRCISERLLRLEGLIGDAKPALIATPDAMVAEKYRAAGLCVLEVERPRGDAIARLGWRKIQAGNIVSPEELEANYIRRSDAEIFSSPASR